MDWTAIKFFSLSVYFILFLIAISVFVWTLDRQRHRCRLLDCRVPVAFHWALISFCYVRLVWAVVMARDNPGDLAYVVNRFALLLFFTTETIVLFWWIQEYLCTATYKEGFVGPSLRLLVISNTIVYIFMIATCLTYLLGFPQNLPDNESIAYNMQAVGTATVYLCLSGLTFFYALLAFLRARLAVSFADDREKKMKNFRRISVVSFIITVCFLCRVIGWSWRPITGNYMPEWVFMSLSYYIPEIIPSIVSLGMIQFRLIEQNRHNKFLANLYQTEGEEDVDEDAEPYLINDPPIEALYNSYDEAFTSDFDSQPSSANF